MERKAFAQARFAVRDEAVALDLVQDAMLRLAEKYGDRPTNELPALFQRILQNGIRDHYRRSKVRNRVTTLFSTINGDSEGEFDFLEIHEVEATTASAGGPEEQVAQKEITATIQNALENLPERQREAFLMRYWYEMDTAETAAAMKCSEGSVKTHCSRATRALAAALTKLGVTL